MITDDQIRRLKRMLIGMPVKSVSDEKLIRDCVIALTDQRAMAFQMPGVREGVERARARCETAWISRQSKVSTTVKALHCISCYDVVKGKPKQEPCECRCHR